VCGICGKLLFDREARVSPELVKAMADSIRHRGPDDEGYYLQGPVALGFRRLSIIDLSTGHQPLSNEDASIWIVFNGEIYNYRELRTFLIAKGHVFKTQTDTEVIVHLYEELGPECVRKLRGMFAFAIWDGNQKLLFVARDRVGIKPLYYYLSQDFLSFGSEVKALLTDPAVHTEVDPAMIDRFLTFGYVPGETTLFQNISKLAPGSYMTVRSKEVEIKQYWDLDFTPSGFDLSDAKERLVALLEESVGLHMISDVPVGFLLSGGVDSTAMLSFGAGKTTLPLSSYTIGFTDSEMTDERPFARDAAKIYGVEHHEMTMTAQDFVDFLPQYTWHMEEPVCEPPAVALFYISRLARNFVKVLLSGEGGDEAFAGYPNYRTMLWLERIKKTIGPFAGPVSKGLLRVNQSLSLKRVSDYARLMAIPLESYYYSRTSTPFRFFSSEMNTFYSNDFLATVDKKESIKIANQYFKLGPQDDWVNRMLYVDTKTWLPDDLLLKADKMTMANSIELRVPLLDHKLLEFAASLPGSYKVRRLSKKYILKKALKDRVPKEILNRKKAGFPVPYNSWLRNELKDWIHALLLDDKTVSRGYFKKNAVEKLLSEELRTGNYSKEVFSLATLELWHRSFFGNATRTERVPTGSSSRLAETRS
jgi:asparagine synthase (glutamine-hydrolysing)